MAATLCQGPPLDQVEHIVLDHLHKLLRTLNLSFFRLKSESVCEQLQRACLHLQKTAGGRKRAVIGMAAQGKCAAQGLAHTSVRLCFSSSTNLPASMTSVACMLQSTYISLLRESWKLLETL